MNWTMDQYTVKVIWSPGITRLKQLWQTGFVLLQNKDKAQLGWPGSSYRHNVHMHWSCYLHVTFYEERFANYGSESQLNSQPAFQPY